MKKISVLFQLKTKLLKILLVICLTLFGCSNINLPPIKEGIAQERVFLDLSLELMDEYELPPQSFQDTSVGGLSGITYDVQKDLFYAISDDASKSDARFYTLKIDLNQKDSTAKINNIEIKKVTFLKDKNGKIYLKHSIDPEGIAISPRNTLFISSEGAINLRIPPSVEEYDFNGNVMGAIKIPDYYLPNDKSEPLSKGVQDNTSFEALAIKANGTMAQDPFRLFVGTEAALIQDIDPENPQTRNNSRFLHYVINPVGEPVLIGEHIYNLDKPSFGVVSNGLTELIALPEEGYLLSLERTFGLGGAGAKIFQVVIGNTTDISNVEVLDKNRDNYTFLKKKLILNLNKLGISLDNLEGMTLGPHLKDGSQTLIVISDDNFLDNQKNQILLFKLQKK